MDPSQHQLETAHCEPNAASSSDGELLERFIKYNDESAFETLVQLHGPMVFGVCRRLIGHHHDAEEAFQATFMVLARKAVSVRPPGMVANWLYGVAYRTALKMRTVRAKRMKEVELTVIREPETSDADHWEQLAPVLDQELRRLPDKYRAAVVCCDVEGRSRTDAARHLGWPEGTLKVRLMQGRAILAKSLTRQGVVLSVGTIAAVVSQNAASAAVPTTLAISTAQAAGALVAAKTVSTTAIGTKGVAFAKGMLKPLLVGKAALTTAGAGVAVAAVLLVNPATKLPEPAASLKLPPEVQRALEENASQLSPISVTCKTHFASKLSPTATFDKLKLMETQRSNRFFAESESRVIWKNGMIYMSFKLLAPEESDMMHVVQSETTCDGKVLYRGSLSAQPKGTANLPPGGRARQQPGPDSGPMRSIWKEPIERAVQRQPDGIGAENAYFHPVVGLVIAADGAKDSGGKAIDPKSHVYPAVLNFLRQGGKLLAVENVTLDGQQYVRIELEASNPVQKYAAAYDLDAHRKRLQNQREMSSKQKNPRLSNEQVTMMRRMEEQQVHMAQLIEEQRKLPTTRRYIYYLDPKLHYAVRRFEQRYGSDTLLDRGECSQFEQIPGRALWLPRRIETAFHEYFSVPGTIFPEAFLSQVLEVSAFDGSDVSDDTFALNYTEPGTFVTDGTDPAAANLPGGGIHYMIPARSEDLPAIIEEARKGRNGLTLLGGPARVSAQPEVPLGNHRNEAFFTMALCNLGLLGVAIVYVLWRRRTGGVI